MAKPYIVSICLGPVVQSVVSLTSSLKVISLTVLADSIYNILIFFCWKNVSSFCTAKATHIFSAKKFQHICVSLDVNFNGSLTNDIVSFEQLGPGWYDLLLYHKWALSLVMVQLHLLVLKISLHLDIIFLLSSVHGIVLICTQHSFDLIWPCLPSEHATFRQCCIKVDVASTLM